MRKITGKKIEESMLQESLDYTKYLIYAEQAKEENFVHIARLFQTIAHSERILFRRFLKLSGELGSTAENIISSLEKESFKADEFYPAMFELAGMMNETDAQLLFNNAQQTKNIHRKLFERAVEALSQDKDIPLSGIYVCKNCGFTLEGQPPASCAVCGISRENFKEF